MKINNLKFLIAIFSFSLFFGACEKENVKSKATFWPNIVMNGDELIIHPVGTAYTDPGAVVTVNGAPFPFETVNEVDADAVGWYLVTYSAVNEDGISASQTRTVIVVDSDALEDDLTASFTRVGQAGTVINWAKGDEDYVYIVNNVGGVPPSNASYAVFNVPFVAYNVAPGYVAVPPQVAGDLLPFFCTASLGGSTAISFNKDATPGQTGYVWVVNGGNFGTGARTFRKL